MNSESLKAVQKELLKRANEIVNEAVIEDKIDRMNTNNIERLKIEIYKTLAGIFRDDLEKIENIK